MIDLLETLWDVVLGNALLRWFFIGLVIGIGVVGWMVWQGTDLDAGDAIMGIVVTAFIVLGARVVVWYVRS
jgi:ABC-type glucose/galactose transport system permease subunit